MDNGPNQKSKFDFLAAQQKIKIIRSNQIYGVPANQFPPSTGTSLVI